MAKKKVSDEIVINALRNRERGQPLSDIAKQIGLSKTVFYDRIDRLKDSDIKEAIKLDIRKDAGILIKDLKAQSAKGKVDATRMLFEMGELYIPNTKLNLDLTGDKLGVILIPDKKAVGAPLQYSQVEADYKEKQEERKEPGNDKSASNSALIT